MKKKEKVGQRQAKFKLICFDLDGTIVESTRNIWLHFCTEFGCDLEWKEKAVQDYLKNLITYDEWVEHDIKLMMKQDITKDDFMAAVRKLRLFPHAVETVKELKKRGLKVGIISDSLDIELDVLMPDYKELFDEIFINKLFFDEDGKLSGWKATKYGMERKADGLRRMAEKENIPLAQCVYVGDAHNDVKAAEIAGLSIAFNSENEELRKTSDIVIDGKDLREILRYIN